MKKISTSDSGLAPSEIFKDRLRSAREMRALSQAELAIKAKLPASSIAHFEGGNRKPSFDNLRKLSDALAVTTDYLLGRTEDPEGALSADPLFRDVAKLTDSNRTLAANFIEMLAQHGPKGRRGGGD